MAQSAAPEHDSTIRATYRDVLDAPAHLVAEALDGTLHTHPRPAPLHGLATLALGTDLSRARAGLARVCMAARLTEHCTRSGAFARSPATGPSP